MNNTPTTMQCLRCGETRTTRLTIRWPDRRLRCEVCEAVTLHRSMADPIQGDWREDRNLSPEGSTYPPGPERASDAIEDAPLPRPPMITREIEATLHLANVSLMFVEGLNKEAWLESVITSNGRHMLFVDPAVSQERLVQIATFALEKQIERGRANV